MDAIEHLFTEEELKIIGDVADGTFHAYGAGDTLIFGSHTFPVHRITVDAKKARAYVDSCYEAILNSPRSE